MSSHCATFAAPHTNQQFAEKCIVVRLSRVLLVHTCMYLYSETSRIKTIYMPISSPPPGATQPIVGVYFTALYRALASSRTSLLDHTQRRATVGRTPLSE